MSVDRRVWRWVAPWVLLSLVFLAAPGSAMGSGPPRGVLTFQDDREGGATRDVADCTFFVRGRGLEVGGGIVQVFEDRGRQGVAVLAREPFHGSPDDGGFGFVVGPITLDAGVRSGPILVFAQVDVVGEDVESMEPIRSIRSETVRVHCGKVFVPCVADLRAAALPEGDVRLDWSAVPNATHYFVFRSDGTQLPNGQLEMTLLGNVSATSFTDTTSVVGVTYTYEVVGSDGALARGGSCPPVRVTAVPFFGGVLLGALAAVGGLAGYVWWRRR